MESLVEAYFSMALRRCSVQQQEPSPTCQSEIVPTRSRCGLSQRHWAEPDLLVGVTTAGETKLTHYACMAVAVDFVITGGVMTLTQVSRFPRVLGITLPAPSTARRARSISTEHCLYLTHQVVGTMQQRQISLLGAHVAANTSMVFSMMLRFTTWH